MVWVRSNPKFHLVPTPLPWAGTTHNRLGCLRLHLIRLDSRVGNTVPVFYHPHGEEFPLRI